MIVRVFEGRISAPNVAIQTCTSRAGRQVRPLSSSISFYAFVANSLSCRVVLFFLRRVLLTRLPVDRLHQYLKQRTQNDMQVGASEAVYLTAVLEYLSADQPVRPFLCPAV